MTTNISTSNESKWKISFPAIPFLSSTGSTERLENFVLFCSEVELPDITLGADSIGNPYVDLKTPSGEIKFGSIRAVFAIEELFTNYKVLLNWMLYLKSPEVFEVKRQDIVNASLFMLSNQDNPKVEFTLNNIFPISLDKIRLSKKTKDAKDLETVVTFAIDYFNINNEFNT